jgi:SAM-dependent methyltransferase
MDPRDGPKRESPWDVPSAVAGFTSSPPNPALLRFAEDERRRSGRVRAIDLGCGAGRNAIPLARAGWHVLGTDLSWPMLRAAIDRTTAERLSGRVDVVRAPMDALPVKDRSADLIVAHGIWNLARSAAELRRAVGEAARIAAGDAALFVFTFSRTTLPPDATPVPDESFVFTQFSGDPQCFLTRGQLISELQAAGFGLTADIPLIERNVPPPGALPMRPAPVIWEGIFRYQR